MKTYISPAGGRKMVSALLALILALSGVLVGPGMETVQAAPNTWTSPAA